MRRMTRSLTALCMTLALTLTLVLPAAALEDTQPPQWQEMGYASLDEMLADWGITEQEYYDLFVADILLDQQWLEEHPEEVSAFDPYEYFENDRSLTSFYNSPQEYMEYHELTEEEFRLAMLDGWVYDQRAAEQAARQMAEEKVLAGGSADGINVMVDGRCIPFPEVRPELTNDRTMVPLAPAMTYLGAQVSYEAGTHTAVVTMGDTTLRHPIDTTRIEIDRAGSSPSWRWTSPPIPRKGAP